MKYTAVFVAVCLALVFRIFFVSVYKVPSQSMAPLILNGDFILASQISYSFKIPATNTVFYSHSPQRGDLVVYFKNAKTYIKRVLAAGGEQVEFLNGELTVSGKKCRYTEKGEALGSKLEPYLEVCEEGQRRVLLPVDRVSHLQNTAKTTLLRDQLLVGGDNRSFENAPNALEIVNSDQIIGKPMLIWMSYSSTQDFISAATGIRWNRILTILN